MGDIGSDTSSQLHMMKGAYLALRAIDPNHELLGLVELHPDDGGFDFLPAYFSRCVRFQDTLCISGYARYTLALEAAAKGRPIRLLDTHPPCEF